MVVIARREATKQSRAVRGKYVNVRLPRLLVAERGEWLAMTGDDRLGVTDLKEIPSLMKGELKCSGG